jgi:molybdopterin synthase catalytic subunit
MRWLSFHLSAEDNIVNHPLIDVSVTSDPIFQASLLADTLCDCGALAEFRGIVRGIENGVQIVGLRYELYEVMALSEMRRILEELAQEHSFEKAVVIHRYGFIPVGETAVYVGVLAKHRGEAFALLSEFMNLLKKDVPIWKTEAVPNLT